MAVVITQIIEEFVQQIDTEKEYELKELKQILGDVYKAKTAKSKQPKEPKQPKTKTAKAEDKPKRAPSGYNIYIKKRLETLKIEQPDTPGKQLLTIAAGEWKTLSKQEQEKYKI